MRCTALLLALALAPVGGAAFGASDDARPEVTLPSLPDLPGDASEHAREALDHAMDHADGSHHDETAGDEHGNHAAGKGGNDDDGTADDAHGNAGDHLEQEGEHHGDEAAEVAHEAHDEATDAREGEHDAEDDHQEMGDHQTGPDDQH